MCAYRTIVDVLEEHATLRTGSVAYRYLQDGDNESAVVTFGQLAGRAQAIAAWLQAKGLRGTHVLLAIRHELAFIEAFLGCLYASVVAVPVAIPRRDSELATFTGIADSAGATATLLSKQDATLHARLKENRSAWFIEDAYDAGAPWHRPDYQLEDLAFLQYTSGSTGSPKGVMVTHGNLMSNEHAIQRAMQLGEQTVFVSWLPLFHDMGLIGSVLQPLYLGVSCVLMPPHTFLMKPVRWLEAIDRYRGTTSGAPNFAYDLCVEKTTAEQRTAMDLSSWAVAFNGSEPVRAATLERFAQAFAASGFKRGSFYPCYGMAESTLIVSGPTPGTEPVVRRFAAHELEVGRDPTASAATGPEVSAVGCGHAVVGTEIAIVDPQTHIEVPAGHIGEIWICGASVTSGYFNAVEATQSALGSSLQSRPSMKFLRTGDLGCLHSGTLFIVGRLKDVIIIRGRKHYPQDLEQSAAASNSLLAAGAGAAFAVEDGRGESLVIVHELTRQGWRVADAEDVIADIRETLTREHGVTPSEVVLIKPGTLPRTTSGKVRRSRCKELFQSASFESLDDRVLVARALDDRTMGV